ncbi:MFS transporter [Tumebacillus sp. ITR2]|uniref:MFS transporter n=1 Tax=Tumebacillus amylolyticus TaxID=2801339 RepID=A0ABS1JG80_9BACL|nr:MFS transporter [Tumebacillus amylolyticus]MBL0389290.1 MFS transporter [Tumebacillus amylolyticus]
MSAAMKILLLSAFLMNVGGFMIVPFLALYLTQTLHFSAWELGTVLTTNLLCSRGLPLLTGMIGDRLSHSTTLFTGILIRGIGFIGYGFVHEFAMLLVVAALVGIGGALYDPSVSSVFAKQPEGDRKRIFTYYNQALNAGAILGPLAGGLLILVDPALPFTAGGAVMIALSLVMFLFRGQYQTERTTTRMLASLRSILKQRAFLLYIGAMILFWALFTQLTVSIPIQVFRAVHDETYVSAVFMMNGIAGIVLMFFLRNLFETRAPLLLLRLGVLFMSVSFFLIPMFATLLWLILCILVYTMGETLALPASDLVVSEFGAAENTGAYFGMFEISTAVGGTIGNYLGAYLMKLDNVVLPWVCYGVIGLAMFAILYVLDRSKHPKANTLSV